VPAQNPTTTPTTAPTTAPITAPVAPLPPPPVARDHPCQVCGQPAVIAMTGDNGPTFLCAKHLPAGIGLTLPRPPQTTTAPAATTATRAITGAGGRVVGFPLGDAALIRPEGGDTTYFGGGDYGGGDTSRSGGSLRDARSVGDRRDFRGGGGRSSQDMPDPR